MGNRLSGSKSNLGIASLAGTLFGVSLSHAGALNGIDDPDRVSGSWIVVLKKEAADSEVAQIVSKLMRAHPQVKISAVLNHGQAPGFIMKASDEDAKAIANEDDVKEVDADILLRNVTQP
jgi:hypothetical protein